MDNRTLLRFKAESLGDCEVDEVLEYIEIMQAAARQEPIRLDPLEKLMLGCLLDDLRNRSTKNSASRN